MKKTLFLLGTFLILASCQNKTQNPTLAMNTDTPTTILSKETIYQFKTKDLDGNDFDFASLKGKKILIVNTASECGLTPSIKI